MRLRRTCGHFTWQPAFVLTLRVLLLALPMGVACNGDPCPKVPYDPKGRAEDCQSDDPCSDDPATDQMLSCIEPTLCSRRSEGGCFCEESADVEVWAEANCPDCLASDDGELFLACGEG